MQTLYARNEGDLYEFVVGPKDDQPTKILIHEIRRFSGHGAASPMQWSDLTPEAQHAITKEIRVKYQAP